MDRQLVVMAKAPRLGRVKTRLAREIGDVAALAKAMASALAEPPPVATLQKRAAYFSLARSVDAYEAMIEPLLSRSARYQDR